MAPYAQTLIFCRKEMRERDAAGYASQIPNIPTVLTSELIEESLARTRTIRAGVSCRCCAERQWSDRWTLLVASLLEAGDCRTPFGGWFFGFDEKMDSMTLKEYKIDIKSERGGLYSGRGSPVGVGV